NPFISLVLVTFCGVTIPYATIIKFWRSWIYYLNPYTWSISAMVATELHSLVIQCKPEEFVVFNPPSGQTCAAWAGDFMGYYGGYLENPNATDACHYCQYQVGDEF
ncbi:hypothetical protein BDZ89DRAFT_884191, partial [Hymenopellis radicata]